jgi:hypothetical protein
MVASSILSGQIASRLGHVRVLLISALMVLVAAFAFMYFTLSPDLTRTDIAFRVILIGLGLGPTWPLYTLLVQNAAAPHQVGAVTSSSIFARSVGQLIGLALFGTLFSASLASSLTAGTQSIIAELPIVSGEIVGRALAGSDLNVDGGGSTAVGFDAAAVRERVVDLASPSASDGVRDEVGAVRGGVVPEPVSGEVGPLSVADLEAALGAVDALERTFAESLTNAFAGLYLTGAALALVGLGLTLLIPGGDPVRRSRPARWSTPPEA